MGQDHVKQTFLNALKRGSLTHAYLFAGSRGTGKTSTARIIARALNCENPAPDGEPCNECAICADALKGRLIDFIEIDAASNRGIDEIRDLKEKIQFSPSRAKTKIYVIDEVHMLTKEAFNALLKTLEEPPAHAYFILATTEAHKIPETIISRTQRFDFHRISEDEIANHLAVVAGKENIKFEKTALELIAKQSAGGMRDALGMLEQFGAGGEISVENVAQNLGLTKPKAVEDFVFALLFEKINEALETIDGLVREGVNLVQFNKTVLAKLREVMLQKVAENQPSETKKILKIIQEFTRANEELKNAVIPQLPLEAAVVIVCHRGVEASQSVSNSFSNASSSSNASARNVDSEPEKIESKKDESSKKLDQVERDIVAEKVETGEKISVPMVEAVLPQVLGKIQNPTVKMVLRDAKILEVTSNKIKLGIGSDFLIEKLGVTARELIIDKFSEVLGRRFEMEIARVETEIQSAAPEASQVPVAQKKTVAEAADGMFEEGW